MKEDYFTLANIDRKSNQFLRRLKGSRGYHRIPFQPGHSALLVIDMQRYFLDKSSEAFLPSALPIIPKIKGLCNTFRKAGLPVVLTRHLNDRKNAGILKAWWGDLITAADPLSKVVPELRFSGSMVIKKTQYDAFYLTHLEKMLKDKGVRQVVITGVMTHLCCETTARSAFMRGFAVFFSVDGTATQNEDFHRATLINLSHGFAEPVLVQEVQSSVESFNNGR